MKTSILSIRGGKHYLLDEIVGIYNATGGYPKVVDVFGGSGQVLLNLKSPYKVYNDIDEELVNIFNIILDNTDELIHLLQTTPPDRDIFNSFRHSTKTNDNIESAFRYLYVNTLTYAGRMDYPSFFPLNIRKYINLPDKILEFKSECKNWIIENLDFETVIRMYDDITTFFYLDPPYLGYKWYKYSFTLSDMVRLSRTIKKMKGSYILNTIYNEDHVNILGEPDYIKEYTTLLDRSRPKRKESFYISLNNLNI